MADHEVLTADYFRQFVDYDPDTGIFRWRSRPVGMFGDDGRGGAEGNCARWNGRFAGKNVKKTNADGYIQICICGKFYMASRVAWLLMTGSWPDDEIDHINRIRDDNKFNNLREATRSENNLNRRSWRNSAKAAA